MYMFFEIDGQKVIWEIVIVWKSSEHFILVPVQGNSN